MDDNFPDVSIMSEESIQQEINDHMGDSRNPDTNRLPYWNKNDPKHDAVSERVTALYQALYPPPEKKPSGTPASKTPEAVEEERTQTESMLRDEWGEDFDGNVELAQSGFQALLNDENLVRPEDRDTIQDLADQIGNNPAAIRLFHRIGRLLKEQERE